MQVPCEFVVCVQSRFNGSPDSPRSPLRTERQMKAMRFAIAWSSQLLIHQSRRRRARRAYSNLYSNRRFDARTAVYASRLKSLCETVWNRRKVQLEAFCGEIFSWLCVCVCSNLLISLYNLVICERENKKQRESRLIDNSAIHSSIYRRRLNFFSCSFRLLSWTLNYSTKSADCDPRSWSMWLVRHIDCIWAHHRWNPLWITEWHHRVGLPSEITEWNSCFFKNALD